VERAEPAVQGLHRHADGTLHAHDGEHAHETRRLTVERSILAQNESRAAALSARLRAQGIDVVGLVGGPGSGKTTLLEATLRARGAPDAQRQAVVEGDCATDLDARRIAACGARVVQVETGGLCHLDATHVEAALARLDLDGVERIFVENVGNLVCPAAFACGEARRVVLISTPEGDEKPLKYPAVFARADLLLVTKIDLLPHLDFDVARCIDGARRVRPDLPVLLVSARSGEGMEAWLRWLAAR
jgi:hydrogenase nickel incorporation protein HypB